jgi:hypothetical protein
MLTRRPPPVNVPTHHRRVSLLPAHSHNELSTNLCCRYAEGLPGISELYAARAQTVLEVEERDMMERANHGVGVGGTGGEATSEAFFNTMMTTPGHVWVYLCTGTRDLGCSHFARASDAFLLCADASEKSGDNQRWQQALVSLAFLASITGHATESLAMYRQAFMSGHRSGDSRAQSWGLMGMIRLSLSRGMVDDALLLTSTTYDDLAARRASNNPSTPTPTPLFTHTSCVDRYSSSDLSVEWRHTSISSTDCSPIVCPWSTGATPLSPLLTVRP